MITLRPYQQDLIGGIRAAYAGGAGSVLGVMPTGAGKTVCFSYMAAAASERGRRVGIVAHRAEILDQIGRTLRQFGVHHGYIAPGFTPDPFAPVQVCSVQAMARKIERYVDRPFDFLIVDEAHHAAAGTGWHAVINAHRGKHVLGVTATPRRLSGEPLSIAFDRMVMGPTPKELTRLGALTPYRLFAPFRPDMSGVSRRAGDFVRSEVGDLMDKPTITGDAVAHYRRICNGKRAVVFCVSVSHAEHVAAQFVAAGIPAASLDGGMSRDERKAVLRQFEDGDVPILTSCDIVSEGFDVPSIEAAILLRPTDSLALYLQQVGRALRPADGKSAAIILDHAGNSVSRLYGGRGHGFPDDDREWSLDGERGVKAGGGERTIPTVICGVCFAVFRPAPCCPECGSRRDAQGREITQVDGVLEEVDPNLVRMARREEQDKINERVRLARGLSALCRVAIDLGRDEKWVFVTHKTRGNPGLMFAQVVAAMRATRKEMQNEQA